MVGAIGGAMMLIGFFVFLNYPLRGRREPETNEVQGETL
jgi:hypothetical protein